MWTFVVFSVFIYVSVEVLRASLVCHDDPTYQPYPGLMPVVQFTWLGALQYIHIKRGTPHYFRVPRVVLITRRFVLCTARDAADVPAGYALGNIIFGEYEKDEEECEFNETMVEMGVVCDPVALMIPISDVLINPEYVNFNVQNSVAMLRLLTNLQSEYVIPVCLPLVDYTIFDKKDEMKPEMFYHIDFVNDVPRDFMDELKLVNSLNILNKNECMILDERTNVSANKEGCTTGCNLRSGAPTIIHEHTGHWSLIALAEGGTDCIDPYIDQKAQLPSKHILIYPYVHWITKAITGRSTINMEKDDPFGFVSPKALFAPENVNRDKEQRAKGWVGRWWMAGQKCYERGEAAARYFRFYHEVFLVHLTPTANKTSTALTYYLEIKAPPDVVIICVKVGVGYRLATPRVWRRESTSILLRIVMRPFVMKYEVAVEAFGENTTLPENEEDHNDAKDETRR